MKKSLIFILLAALASGIFSVFAAGMADCNTAYPQSKWEKGGISQFAYTGKTGRIIKAYRKKPSANGIPGTSPYSTAAAAEFADRLNSEMPSDKNYMFSPLSVKMAFALAANGASGETESEILKTFGIENLNSFNGYSKKLIDTYSSTNVLKLDIANSVWINTDSAHGDFAAGYKKMTADYYNAEAKQVNNQNAVETINNWVAEKTDNKIKSITNNPDFSAMLINAVYFKAAWQKPFNEKETRKDEFTSRNGEKAQIDFMNKTDDTAYIKKDGITAVKLPYTSSKSKLTEDGDYEKTETVNAQISMYVMSADSKFSPARFLEENKDNFEYAKVKLAMPKFELEYSATLKETLKKLGINKAFSEDAEFQRMFDNDSMFISDVLHKTYIKVTEKDTEAAAVTAIMMETTSFREPEIPIEIKFNKPFTYIIKDDANGEILFMGEYAFAK